MRLRVAYAALSAAVACALGLTAATALGGRALTRPEASFPCRWAWELRDGFRTGHITAVNSANCAGRQGSLTLSARLLRWNPKTKKWHTDRAQTRTWTNLSGNRYVGLDERCVTATVRAEFGWILRDSAGSVVARHSVKSGNLKVPGPDCQITIG